MSPAMAARIMDRLRDIGDIVKLIEEWEARDMSRILSVAFCALTLSAPALAQTRVMTEHDQTASALKCLLDHNRTDCKIDFVGSATGPARYWLWWNANKDFGLGPLVSSEYAGTEAVNRYLTIVLDGRPADVYDVKFKHRELTFYIARDSTDGKIHYIHTRSGPPDDEKMYLFAYGPG